MIRSICLSSMQKQSRKRAKVQRAQLTEPRSEYNMQKWNRLIANIFSIATNGFPKMMHVLWCIVKLCMRDCSSDLGPWTPFFCPPPQPTILYLFDTIYVICMLYTLHENMVSWSHNTPKMRNRRGSRAWKHACFVVVCINPIYYVQYRKRNRRDKRL